MYIYQSRKKCWSFRRRSSNILKHPKLGTKNPTPQPPSTIRNPVLGALNWPIPLWWKESWPRSPEKIILRFWVKGCDCQAGTWNCASPECNQNSLHFVLCPFPFHPVVHHMCLWHCLNCLQHLQTTYFARQSEVVKAVGHWPWREAHHLNWWSILFTCRRRKLWSARCKCHCNMGNASPTCICDSSVPHDWAPSGCCRHTGASYYYYLSCLPQLRTKDKCPMLFWGWSLVSNTSTRRLLQHVTMWISLPRSPFCSPMQASRSYYHHLTDKSLDSMDSMDRKISCHTPHKHIYVF